jgi:hypothetical protein
MSSALLTTAIGARDSPRDVFLTRLVPQSINAIEVRPVWRCALMYSYREYGGCGNAGPRMWHSTAAQAKGGGRTINRRAETPLSGPCCVRIAGWTAARRRHDVLE